MKKTTVSYVSFLFRSRKFVALNRQKINTTICCLIVSRFAKASLVKSSKPCHAVVSENVLGVHAKHGVGVFYTRSNKIPRHFPDVSRAFISDGLRPSGKIKTKQSQPTATASPARVVFTSPFTFNFTPNNPRTVNGIVSHWNQRSSSSVLSESVDPTELDYREK